MCWRYDFLRNSLVIHPKNWLEPPKSTNCITILGWVQACVQMLMHKEFVSLTLSQDHFSDSKIYKICTFKNRSIAGWMTIKIRTFKYKTNIGLVRQCQPTTHLYLLISMPNTKGVSPRSFNSKSPRQNLFSFMEQTNVITGDQNIINV